ncbi:MAG: HEPN domain-containing protein [Elusimicrobia bacterium]|nr:HEPN domain-containing protein [Elusimicrobiota bacterium]
MKNTFEILLEKAEEDRRAAAALLAAKDSPEGIIVFHVQQLAEKLLKAFLIFRKTECKPTHNMIFLLEKAVAADASFSEFSDLADELAPFAVLIRYEEGYEVTIEEARSLFERTLRLRNRILAEIGEGKGFRV